ncbi:reverse transcriptase domain-containing protein [Tanacetum coccineum]
MLKRYEETNLVLNWEKCHFMVKERIILGHKVSGSEIEVDKAKIEEFSKLSYPTNVKAIRSFLGHAAFDKLKRELKQAPIMIKPDWSFSFEIMYDASDYAVEVVLGQRIDKHFKPIHYASKTMDEAQENYTTIEKELLAIVFAFDKFYAKPRLIKWIMLLQEFDIEIRDKKGAENIAADHLSRLENPDLGKLTKAKIRNLFPEERLMEISNKNNEPCNSGVTCEDEAKRRKSGTKMKTFEENCYLLLYAVSSKEVPAGHHKNMCKRSISYSAYHSSPIRHMHSWSSVKDMQLM